MTDEQLEAFEAKRREGIKDTVRFVMEHNPGMTWEQADAEMRRLVADELRNPMALAFEADCLAMFEKIAPQSWLKRRAQRARRRVRMARKRRRGW